MATWAKIKFYYDSIPEKSGVTITATSTESIGDYDVKNIAVPLEGSFWQAEDASLAKTQIIDIDAGVGNSYDADYFAMIGHNLNTAGAKIALRWSEDGFVNKLTNGDFEDGGQTPWSFWTDVTASMSLSSSAPYEGSYKCLITITDGGVGVNRIQLYQGGMSIISGKKYMVRFAAKAAGARTINIRVQKHTLPYTNFGLDQTINLTTSWQIFELSFTANTTAADVRLDFLVGDDNNDVELDEISLDDSVDTFTAYSPAADTVQLNEFTAPGAKRYWRFCISGLSGTAPYASIIKFGLKSELDYATASFDPQAQDRKANINVSYGGYVTGIHEQYTERRISLKFSEADTSLYTLVSTWWEDNGLKNFFVAWDLANNPTEIFLMRGERGFNNPLTNNGAYRDITINLLGRKE